MNRLKTTFKLLTIPIALGLILASIAFLINRFTIKDHSSEKKLSPEIEKLAPQDIESPPEPLNQTNSSLPEEELTTNPVQIKELVIKKAIKTTERDDMLFYDSEKYQFVYFSKEDEYLISILTRPFDEVRKEAESRFLSVLRINIKTACGLTVHVSSPIAVSPEAKGKIYGLSFCEQL